MTRCIGPCGTALGRHPAKLRLRRLSVVGDAQLLPEQPEHARGEALGLAQGEVEDEPQHQHQLNRRVRVPGLAARCGPPRRLPSGDGGFVQPEGQVTAPLQPSL
jgi:hypothetical protein